MNTLLWVLQGLAALVYGASGVMKIFMFDKISADVRSFDALPRHIWRDLGMLELICVVGLIAPVPPHWQQLLVSLAAGMLALESLVFIRVHLKYREVPSIVMSAALGLLMAFVAYGRAVLAPFV